MTKEDEIKQDVAEIKEMVIKLYNRLFIGNGQPPITVQIDRLNTFKKAACWIIGAVFVMCLGVAGRLIYLGIAT